MSIGQRHPRSEQLHEVRLECIQFLALGLQLESKVSES